jgi:metallo-beta-lactamase family protein
MVALLLAASFSASQVTEAAALGAVAAIIISASGMCEAGRILHHLRNNIGNPKNTILIVSWQAPYTLGRRLADGEKIVNIFGEEHEVKAEVATISGLSAHAGQDFLTEYALRVKGRVKQLFLVHGEPAPAEASLLNS